MPSAQLVRQWAVVQELAASRRGRTLTELARSVEVHPRTARRDVADLAAAGLPVERLPTPPPIRFRLAPGHNLPQAPLSLDEALALHHAALSAPLFDNPGLHRPLEVAVQKVRAAFPPRVAEYLGRVAVAFSHRSPSAANPDTLLTVRVLQEQVADRCRVRFGYRALRGPPTRRTVDPYLLRQHRGDLYLLAFCHLRGDVRLFQTDRIRNCEPLEDEFGTPPDFDAEAVFRTSLGVYLGEPGHAVVRFEGPAARYIDGRPLHPDQEVLERTDGRLTLRVPVQGKDEITYEVLRFAENAEVLEPPELREHVRGVVERMRARYRPD